MQCLLAHAAPAQAAPVAPEKNILLVLWKGSTESELAFKARLAVLGFNARFTEITGDQNRETLATRMREQREALLAGKYDLVYTYGTTVTQVAQAVIANRTPVVFNQVFDPVGSGLVDGLLVPKHNTTGVTNGVPVELQLKAIVGLAPIRRLLLLFNPREPNANVVAKQVGQWATTNGVVLEVRRAAPGTDLLQKVYAEMESGALQVDTVYAGPDSYLASVAREISTKIGTKARLFGGTETFVRNGWLGAFVPILEDMGTSAADVAAEVLGGRPAGSVPVVSPPPRLVISSSMAKTHGMIIPANAVVRP